MTEQPEDTSTEPTRGAAEEATGTPETETERATSTPERSAAGTADDAM
jgi:hypothetical protein